MHCEYRTSNHSSSEIVPLWSSSILLQHPMKINDVINRRHLCTVSTNVLEVRHAFRYLNERIDHGIEVFNMPVEDLKFSTIPKEEYCSSSAGPSTFRKNEKCFLETYENKKTSDVFNWTKEEVLLLIATYKEHQLLFLDESFPKSEAWEKVIHEMTLIRAGQGLPKIDTKKCKTKMEALRRHYKEIKDAPNKSGAQKITWPYYDEMEDLFSEQPWVKPISTAGSNIVDDIGIIHHTIIKLIFCNMYKN